MDPSIPGHPAGRPAPGTGRNRPEPDVRATDAERIAALEAALATEREVVARLVRAIDAKYQVEPDRAATLVRLTEALGRAAGLDRADLEALRSAALLHDVGQLVVPVATLAKPGPLSADEFAQVRLHPRVAAELLADIPGAAAIAAIVRAHHERWDGLGYPDGLRGEAIPLGARILAVVDAFTAMIRPRPHRDARSRAAAAAALQHEAGKAFDPTVVTCFLELLSRLPTSSEDGGVSPTARGERACTMIAQAHRENVAFHELAYALGSSLDLPHAIATISETLVPILPHETCALLMPDRHGALRCRAAHGMDADRLAQAVWPADSAVTQQLLQQRRVVSYADDDGSGPDGLAGRSGAASAVLVPLCGSATPVGAFGVFSRAPAAFSADHERVLLHVCENFAARLINVLHFEQAREDALTDALTGLPNTRFLSMHLTQELARATRQRSQLALLVIDLDDFKRVNDTDGHAMGDRLLVEVARALEASVRPYDVCARYAGDEFVVMLPECGPDEAGERQHELAAAIARVRVHVAAGRVISVTASVGAAVFPDDGDRYEDLLQVADRRMYSSKTTTKAHPTPLPALPPLPARREEPSIEVVLDRWLRDIRQRVQ
ncbi:MAG: diguanylate cyclase [Acidobacteria bacterium]|nr:diguanylate cyclase [Acidobacteriota bacterium]